jgi:hypothetical protein
VSCDDADWITRPVAERCPNALICLDPFHIVKAANDALDEIRREVWNEARKAGQPQLAKEIKGARFALWINPDKLTERQQLKLSRIQKLNQRLYRAYLLAQQLRQIYRLPAEQALALLEAWAQMGAEIAPGAVPKARPADHPAAQNGRSGNHQQAVKRRGRADKHTATPDRTPRFRLPITLGRDRPRDALTRRPLPTPPRTVTPTHGTCMRFDFSGRGPWSPRIVPLWIAHRMIGIRLCR